MALNFQVQLRFVISQHVRDAELMYRLRDFFGTGTMVKDTNTKLQLRIRSLNDLETKLFPLLEKYPLQTQKALDAEAFKQVFVMMKNKEHLTVEGLAKVREIKATMNRARMVQYKNL